MTLPPEPWCFVGEPTHQEETMNREPLITVASLTALVAAVVALVVAFGVPLTDDQQTAILGLAAVVAPLVVGFVARRKVTPA